jgi:hypothetical protein
LRILDIEEVKTVPYTPLSHPFVERVIGTIRRELQLDSALQRIIQYADCLLIYEFARHTAIDWNGFA